MMRIEVEEADMLTVEVEFATANRTGTVFLNKNFGNVRPLWFFIFIHFVFAVNEHHDVGILLDRIVDDDITGNEIMGTGNTNVVYLLDTKRCYAGDLVPVDIGLGQVGETLAFKGLGHRREARPRNARGLKGRAVIGDVEGGSETALALPGLDLLTVD